MRTLCDAYHKEFESDWRSILDISGNPVAHKILISMFESFFYAKM